MQSVSSAFLTAIVADERQIKAKATITLLDNTIIGGTPVYSASSTMDALTPASEAFDNKLVPQWKFAWTGCYPSADLYPVAGDGSSETGWWSQNISDANGDFSTPETLSVDYGVNKTVGTISVIGDEWLGYPVDFDILYSTASAPGPSDWSTLVNVRTNTFTSWGYSCAPVTARWLRLSILKISLTSNSARIVEFQGGYIIDVSDMIKSISITKERNASDESATLPIGNSSANELTLVVDNTDRAFYQRNISSPYYGYLKKDRKVDVSFGVVLADGTTEWVDQGLYYTVSWKSSRSSPETTITAWDRAKQMQDRDFSNSIVYESQTISNLVTTLVGDFGLTSSDYTIDPTAETIPYSYFEKDKYWTHLDKLAAGETGAVYFNETNKFIFENRSHMFTTRLTLGTLPGATSIAVQSVYGLSIGNTIYISDNTTTLSAIIDASWGGTSLTVPLTAALTHEFCQSSYIHRQPVVATLTDHDVLMDMDDQWVLDKTRNDIEVDSNAFIVPLDGVGNPVRQDIYQLTEGLTIPASSYLDVDVFFSAAPIIKNGTYPVNVTITTSPSGDSAYITTSWQPTTPYAWGGHLRISNSHGSSVLVIGCVIDGVALTQPGGITVKASDAALINEQGDLPYQVKSNYVQTRAQAQGIANQLLATWKDPLAPVSATGIGLPHLQLGDRIKLVDTELGLADIYLNNHFHIQSIKLDYDGGLDGTYGCLALATPAIRQAATSPFLIGTSLIGGMDQIA